MALASMAARTEESTPPDRAQSTFALADALPQGLDIVLHEGIHLPVAGAAANIVHEVVQHLLALSSVQHFRVELDRIQALFLRSRRSYRAVDRVAVILKPGAACSM